MPETWWITSYVKNVHGRKIKNVDLSFPEAKKGK